MKFIVQKEVFEKYPGLTIGLVVAKNINNQGTEEKIQHLLFEVENLIKLNFIPENLAKHPLISPWRTVHEEFKGKKAEPSHTFVEQLMKIIFAGKKLPASTKLDSIRSYITLKHLVPVGADDLDKVEGDITLAISTGKEYFRAIGSKRKQRIGKGEVIYKDSKDVLCRKWNWKDADKTKLTQNTKNVIFYIDGLRPVTTENVLRIAKDLKEIILAFCNGEIKIYLIDKNKYFAEI